VADAVDLDDRDRLAITGLGVAEVLLDGAHGWLAVCADGGRVAGKAVADGGGFHGLVLVRVAGVEPAGWALADDVGDVDVDDLASDHAKRDAVVGGNDPVDFVSVSGFHGGGVGWCWRCVGQLRGT